MTSKYEQEKYRQGYSYVIGCDEVGRGSLAGPVVAAAVILPYPAANDKLKVESYKVIKQPLGRPGRSEGFDYLKQIKDSKLLTPKKREKLSEAIKQNCVAYGVGAVEPKIIDEINIHHATLLAMRRAVENLPSVIPSPSIEDDESLKDDIIDDYKFKDKGSLRSSAILNLKIASSVGITQPKRYFLFLDGKFIIPNFHMEQEAVVAGDSKILSVAAASIMAKVHRDKLMRQLHEHYPTYDFAQHKGYGTLHHRRMIIKHGLSDIHRVSFCKNLGG